MQNAAPRGERRCSSAGGNEQRVPTKHRTLIQATPTMALRLSTLKFGDWWAR